MNPSRLAVLTVACLAGLFSAFSFSPRFNLDFAFHPPLNILAPRFPNVGIKLNLDENIYRNFIIGILNVSSWPNHPPPDYLLPNAIQLANDAGYPCKEYKVVTADGYILTMHRINRTPWKKSYPILLMHGLFASSDVWLLNAPDNSLPYALMDSGFDVWLGNFRSNYYSKAHLKYSTKSRKFWNFSFHEMGLFDLPAMINQVLKVSESPDLIYIGLSMGTTTFLVMGAEVSAMTSKVRTAFLLAPIALQPGFDERTPFINTAVFKFDFLYKTLDSLGFIEVLPRNYYLVKTVQDSCSPSSLQSLCLEIVSNIFGRNKKNMNLEHAGYQLSSLVSGTSVRTVHHLVQLFLSGKFENYDYGRIRNKIIYGSSNPPDYNLSKIITPIYLYYAENDILLNTRSVSRLDQSLPNSKIIKVPDPKFTHLDFNFGLNARQIVYDDIVSKALEIVASNNYH